jgi:DNA-binding NtrC family response regulator
LIKDELDKMPKQFQDKLLSFMESGHIQKIIYTHGLGITDATVISGVSSSHLDDGKFTSEPQKDPLA